ncbi:MAG: glycosyltransferase [Myxococcales bacterium]
MTTPWLSVVMPTYDGDAFLAAALESICAQQGGGEIEVIAVDDGSEDGTIATLETYSSRLPLRIVRRPRTGNWVASTNHGLAVARGEYACLLHQDDLWIDGRLRALRAALQAAPDAALVVHPSWFVDARGARLGRWRCPLPPGKVDPALVLERLIVQNFLAVPAPLFRRELALQAGGMDESLWYTADWDLWLNLSRRGTVLHHPEPLVAFRIHAASQTAQRSARPGDLRLQLQTVLRRHLPAAAEGDRRVASVAEFSIELNLALAAGLHRRAAPWATLSRSFLALGPSGWKRYLRDSRIAERVGARLRLLGERGRAPAAA